MCTVSLTEMIRTTIGVTLVSGWSGKPHRPMAPCAQSTESPSVATAASTWPKRGKAAKISAITSAKAIGIRTPVSAWIISVYCARRTGMPVRVRRWAAERCSASTPRAASMKARRLASSRACSWLRVTRSVVAPPAGFASRQAKSGSSVARALPAASSAASGGSGRLGKSTSTVSSPSSSTTSWSETRESVLRTPLRSRKAASSELTRASPAGV